MGITRRLQELPHASSLVFRKFPWSQDVIIIIIILINFTESWQNTTYTQRSIKVFIQQAYYKIMTGKPVTFVDAVRRVALV